MKSARYWRQEFGGDIVKFHCHSWQLVQDPDAFDGRRVLCSITKLVWIKIKIDGYTAQKPNVLVTKSFGIKAMSFSAFDARNIRDSKISQT